jgi:hypothetical protein
MLWSRSVGLPVTAIFVPAILLLAASCADPFIESTTLLGNTTDTVGPYEVRSVVLGLNEGDRVELFYNAIDSSPARYIPLLMEGIDDDGRTAELYTGSIPGQETGSTIRYYVAIDRNGGRIAEDPVGGDLQPFIINILP